MMPTWVLVTVVIIITITIPQCGLSAYLNFQIVHFLDPSEQETVYYASWNSDQWIKWLRGKYAKEVEASRQGSGVGSGAEDDDIRLKKSWVNIIIPVTQQDFKTAYTSDSMQAYSDPQKSDYFWSDYAFPMYVIIRSPNATINITADEAANREEEDTGRRVVYGYNVYNCGEKKMFVNAKIDYATEEPVYFQTFFPKKVKNPKDKLRIPLSACTKVSQKRGLLDEIRFQLGSTNLL